MTNEAPPACVLIKRRGPAGVGGRGNARSGLSPARRSILKGKNMLIEIGTDKIDTADLRWSWYGGAVNMHLHQLADGREFVVDWKTQPATRRWATPDESSTIKKTGFGPEPAQIADNVNFRPAPLPAGMKMKGGMPRRGK